METKQVIKSFPIPNGKASKPVLEKALRNYVEDKERREKLKFKFYRCEITWEVIECMDNIRVNVYNATDGDLFWIGVEFNNAYRP